ncbi:MAG TPA: hypothetical protein PKA63_12275 [Oligoflexia bacterium]|nr:hypothetical protein [Oligoflexia bacterium]HMP49432.1 hypothetical protein [Oligoflexia bacterium]
MAFATLENFSNRETVPARYGYIGNEAPNDIEELYLGESIRKQKPWQGAANPIQYSFS